ncbi:hypothetical protein [Modestobacter sp. VKM Ac-2983]|nr:hypothetical protein [Modestobacter sp. VKM Ac-2983]
MEPDGSDVPPPPAVDAAFLVLAFHPVLAAFALWFTDWTQRR